MTKSLDADRPRRAALAFVSSVHPSTASPGTGRFNEAMLRGLLADWDLTAFVPVPWHKRGGPPTNLLDPTDYPVHEFSFWYLPGRFGRPRRGASLFRQLQRAASKVLEAATPEVLLSYWAYPDAEAAGRLAQELQIPSAVIVGGSDLLIQARDPHHRHRVLKAISRHERVFAVGEHLRDTLIRAGVADERIRMLERGVDRRHFHPGDRTASRRALELPLDRRIVLWAGRMEPVKDLPTLVRAVATLPHHDRPLLALVGQGHEAARVKRLALEMGVDLICPGSLAPTDLGAWYRAADVVALASLSEGTPNVLLEAAASGIRFVTTDAGGAALLGRRLGAPVVPIGDPEALGHAIGAMLEDASATGRALVDAIPSLDDASAHLSADLRELLPDGH